MFIHCWQPRRVPYFTLRSQLLSCINSTLRPDQQPAREDSGLSRAEQKSMRWESIFKGHQTHGRLLCRLHKAAGGGTQWWLSPIHQTVAGHKRITGGLHTCAAGSSRTVRFIIFSLSAALLHRCRFTLQLHEVSCSQLNYRPDAAALNVRLCCCWIISLRWQESNTAAATHGRKDVVWFGPVSVPGWHL